MIDAPRHDGIFRSRNIFKGPLQAVLSVDPAQANAGAAVQFNRQDSPWESICILTACCRPARRSEHGSGSYWQAQKESCSASAHCRRCTEASAIDSRCGKIVQVCLALPLGRCCRSMHNLKNAGHIPWTSALWMAKNLRAPWGKLYSLDIIMQVLLSFVVHIHEGTWMYSTVRNF